LKPQRNFVDTLVLKTPRNFVDTLCSAQNLIMAVTIGPNSVAVIPLFTWRRERVQFPKVTLLWYYRIRTKSRNQPTPRAGLTGISLAKYPSTLCSTAVRNLPWMWAGSRGAFLPVTFLSALFLENCVECWDDERSDDKNNNYRTRKGKFCMNYRFSNFVLATINTLQTKIFWRKMSSYLPNRIYSNFVCNLQVNAEPVFNFRRLPSPISFSFHDL